MFDFWRKRAHLAKETQLVLNQVAEVLPPEDISNSQELIDRSEWGLALSVICVQLHEYDLTISQRIFDEIESLANAMKMDPTVWQMLRQQIR